MFQRLIGLETEYALRLPEVVLRSDGGIHSHRDAFEAISRSLRARLPTAEADRRHSGKPGLFLGTGGAVWFESLRPSTGTGLIEGATPECRGVRELIACQRAQDRLLSEAARDHGLALIKNCRDHRGKTYGAQENYEVTFAEGGALWLWRATIVLILLPLTLLLQAGAGVVIFAACLTVPITAVLHLVLRFGRTRAERRRSFDFWIGPVWRTGWDGIELPVPGWLSRPVLWLLLASVAPLAAAVWALVQCTQLGRVQRQLTAFLATRAVFAGAGGIAPDGRFQLAEKAGGVACVAGLAEFARPIFSLGQFMKPCCLLQMGSLWRGRQRLQITLGDSNLCEEAEYLRVGATLLIVEALEARSLEAPQLAHPVRALHAINNDCSLTVRVPLRDGRMMSALEIQRWYLTACSSIVKGQTDCPDEFHRVLRLWEDVLDRLETDRDSLVGRIDWVTKRFLMDRVAGNAPAQVRKKVAIKYHELSRAGYFRLLEQAGLHARVLADEEVSRALRLPPTGTPALRRARLIREFAGTGLRGVSWTSTSARFL